MIAYYLEHAVMDNLFRYDLQGVDHFKKIQHADGITYEELFLENEKTFVPFYFQNMCALLA